MENILCQDNKSIIPLENNSKSSSSKRTGALNVRCFFLTDQIWKKNLSVVHCPTNKMVGDYVSKPLQGKQRIQNFEETDHGTQVLLIKLGNRSVSEDSN